MIKTKDDWILAGIDTLANYGVDNVKIEALARKLGVSKGGFYGYFLNRDELLQAMLDYWAETFTSIVIETISSLEGGLSEKLKNLLSFVDDKAEKVVMRVVKERLLFVTNLFQEEGFSRNEASNRAHLVHHFMSGCRLSRPLLPKNGSPERYKQLDQFIKIVTAPVT